jgi:uncharacterized membrane protein
MANNTLTSDEELASDEQAAPIERGTAVATDAKSSIADLDENVVGALAYLFGFVTGIVVLMLEKESPFARFQAAQSIVVFGGLFVASAGLSLFSFVLGILLGDLLGFLLGGLLTLASFGVWLAAIGLWAFLIYRAYSGTTFRVPVAAGLADRLV